MSFNDCESSSCGGPVRFICEILHDSRLCVEDELGLLLLDTILDQLQRLFCGEEYAVECTIRTEQW